MASKTNTSFYSLMFKLKKEKSLVVVFYCEFEVNKLFQILSLDSDFLKFCKMFSYSFYFNFIL